MTPWKYYSIFVIAIAVITQFTTLFSYKSIRILKKRDNETVGTFLVESVVSTFTPSSANIQGFLEEGYPEDACSLLQNDHDKRATVLLATTSGCTITQKILTAGKMGYSALLLYAEDDENPSSYDKLIADAHIRKGLDNVEYVAHVTKEDALILKNSYSYPSSVRFYISTENNCHFYNCRFFIPLGRLSFLEITIELLLYSVILVFMYSAIIEIKAVVYVAIMAIKDYRERKHKARETFAWPLVDVAQLENELEKVNDELEKKNNENENNNRDLCVICQHVMGEFDVQNLPCNHWFHVDCLEELTIKYNAKICPTCRCKVKMNDNFLYEIDTEPEVEDKDSDLRQMLDELIQQIVVEFDEIEGGEIENDEIEFGEISDY